MYYAIYDPPESMRGTHWSLQDEAAREVGRFHLEADALEAAAGMNLIEYLAEFDFGNDETVNGADVVDAINEEVEFYEHGEVVRGRPRKRG